MVLFSGKRGNEAASDPDRPAPSSTITLDLSVGEDSEQPEKRSWWSRWWNGAVTVALTDSSTSANAEIDAVPPLRGFEARSSTAKANRGWYAPVHAAPLTTTRQAEVLNPALISSGTDHDGILIGVDCLSNSLIALDPFTAYEKGVISSPNVIILGDIGEGKSSLGKTVYVIRPLIFTGRRVVVFDKKDRNGEGEYAELTRRFGSEPLTFRIGVGGTRLNLLDDTILAGSGVSGQHQLLYGIAELANNEERLSTWQRKALRVAHRRTRQAGESMTRAVVLADLINQLGNVQDDPSVGHYSPAGRERLHQSGLEVQQMLESLLAEEMAGIFDGETSDHVRLSDRLTTFDISQLPGEGPAVSMIMQTVNQWLFGVLRNHRGRQTTVMAEEGWHMLRGPGARMIQSNTKLSRALGLNNAFALHHLSDVPVDSIAMAMIKEAGIKHVYKQMTDDEAKGCEQRFNMHTGASHLLQTLKKGHHFLKVGSEPEMHVRHTLSRLEAQLINTDEAMVRQHSDE